MKDTTIRRVPVRTGRPRKPEISPGVLDAALRLYGERGWSGLSIRSVCELAGVGRSSIYSRWSSLDELLTAAFVWHLSAPAPAADAFRENLIAEARLRAAVYLGKYSKAVYRLMVEGQLGLEPAAPIYRQLLRTEIHREQALIEGAVASGELPAESSVRRILDRIEGTVVMHIQSSPATRLDEVRAGIDVYVQELVDDVLDMERARAARIRA
ncbi:MAG: TetR/AcrR family transcriptional regulator [Actinobacteria bacterium]|nr:TetR/AcrR family transcriptional regulator [Actinomycetota bacterium]